MICLYKVWTWLKKYWKWLLFPVGIILGIISMWRPRKPGKVVPPEVLKAEEDRQKHQLEAEEKARKAEEAKKKAVENLEKEHAETLDKLTDEQKAKVDELREDPDKLNEFLIGVGKEIRG